MPGPGPMNFQAVVLAGGLSKELFPLVSKDIPKALLPVGNKPLLSYTLEMLEANNFRHLYLVVVGEDVATKISTWIAEAFKERLVVEVVVVPDDSGTADALRAVAHKLTADDIIVIGGDLVCDVPLGSVAAAHRRYGAACTVLLGQRPSSGSGDSSKDKSRQVPQDYIGLDVKQQALLFCATASDTDHVLQVRRSVLRAAGQMTLRTDLIDTHLYVFQKHVFDVLDQRPAIRSLKKDLLPYLARSQLASASALGTNSNGSKAAGGGEHNEPPDQPDPHCMGELSDELSHSKLPGLLGSCTKTCAYIAESGRYCARINSLAAYADANRDVAGDAAHLTGLALSSTNNFIHTTAIIGTKTTIGPACLVGEGSRLADKSSVKRSVVGRGCRIGSNVKVINSVVMNNVTIEDGCLIQSSVLSSNVLVAERATLKDCYVGSGYSVGAGVDHRNESLAHRH